MSSSYRRVTHLALAVGAACSLGAAATAHSAQTFIEPQMDLRAEMNSNVDLNPDGSPDGTVEGYIANLEVLLGYATPRGETSIRPRLRFQHYPDRDQREKVEGFLDWVTHYQWQRSQFDLIARYSQQDSYNFDTRSGEFDPLDPNDPTAAGSGRFLTGQTQTDIEVRPNYSYNLTERLSVGVGGDYQTTSYDADKGPARYVDYDFWLVNANLRWALDERSHVGVGGYYSEYDPQIGRGASDSYGVAVIYDHMWSEVMGLEATLGYETNEQKEPAPGGQGDQSTSSVGGSIGAHGEGEVSKWRVVASQRYAPSGDGRMRQIGQVRFQYDRKFTERLDFQGVARYESQEQLSGSNRFNKDTGRLDTSLRWRLSPTWYLQGGYVYVWQKEGTEGDADNNKIYLSVGYKGLRRKR